MTETDSNREVVAFGRTVDWDTEVTTGALSFADHEAAEEDALPPETVRELTEHETVETTEFLQDGVEALISLAERIQRDVDGNAQVGLTGKMFSPDNEFVDAQTVIDGLTATAGDGATFSLQLQRDVFEQHRHADTCAATDREIVVWYD